VVPRSALALACAAALAACAPDAPPPAEPGAPAGEAAPGATPDVATQLGLSWIASEDGTQLTLRNPDGSTLLALSCANRTMTALAPGFEEVASEERFSLGADDQVFILVAQLGQADGVRAEGAPAEEFLNRLPTANSVHANYGAQNLGPHVPPSRDQARAFAAACRG
jgi:hypothetical protein